MRVSRVVYPVILGIAVVLYLLYRQFDSQEFSKISWELHTLIWLGVAIGLLIARHLAYATRLYILSNGKFGWLKCIQLIFIWEFSSAVSPTTVGGSAVALFVLSQEDLPASKTTAIIIYTIVLDSVFFIFTIPVLYLLYGPTIIRPNMQGLLMLDGWGLTFSAAYLFMALYGTFFFYGLFIRPQQLKKLMIWIAGIGFLKRYKEKILRLGKGFVTASHEMRSQGLKYHAGAFLATCTAWSLRFLVISAIIIAIVKSVPLTLSDQGHLYARLQTMFVILAFSPTPGGAGFHEIVFGGFLSDYVPVGIAVVVAFIWRLLTYYGYLLAGAIVIPHWLRRIIKKRQMRKATQAVEE